MQKYIKNACTILLLLAIFLSCRAHAAEQLVNILEGVRKRYGHVPGLTLTYKREIITKSMTLLGGQGNSDLATGRIHFRPPYSLKIQQDTPKSETVISDGDRLWWYIPDKKQVYVYPFHVAGRELALLSDIFQGLKEVSESFIVMLSGIGAGGEYQLKLTPNPPWPQTEHINLSVTQGDFSIRIVEIHNYIGGITRFIFGNLSTGKRYGPEFFKFTVPAGVKVIEEGT